MEVKEKNTNQLELNAIAGGLPEITKVLGADRFNRPFPLTDIQQAYWIGRQDGFSLGNISAHGYMEVDCDNLDLNRFEAAFNSVIHRHDMLRAIVSKKGEQMILADVPHYDIKTVDVSTADEPERKKALEETREVLSHQVLDSSVWPLFDVRATKVSETQTRLHFSLDVLIFDAHSFDLISEELNVIYNGQENTLKPLTLSYADYVLALNELPQTDLYKQSENYWRNKIKTLPPGPELPIAVSPESISKPEFKRRCKTFDKNLWQQFKENAQSYGITPSSALLAVYGYVLSRWSGNDSFTLNLTLFNRLPFHEEVNDLVGDFTSVVLLAMDYSKTRAFYQQASDIQDSLWQDLDHRFVSGVWVLRELQEARRSDGPQLMPVVFTSALKQDVNDDSAAAMSWLGEVSYTITQTPQVWLDHQVGEDEGKLICDWDAVEALFPEGCLDDMFAAYTNIIYSLSQADKSAWEYVGFEVRSPEQLAVIQQTNETSADIPTGLLHQPILERCISHPENIALIQEDKEVSYGELYKRSNYLAYQLWQQGIEPNELVAVLLPKGIDQIVAVLAILQAGGSYVPIESSYPDERINQLLELANIKRMISSQAVLAERKLKCDTQFTLVEQAWSAEHNIIQIPPMQEPEDVAYIIYTSGSTGQPKGVVIDHRGALNTVVDINTRLGVTENDRVLALSALNFDLSVYDIFGILSAGGALVFPPEERRQEPSVWADLIKQHKVTIWNTVPALMDIYVSYMQKIAHLTDYSLQWVLMSGDWINLSLPDSIRKTCPYAKPISLGGATEASIWSIWYPIEEVKSEWKSIPYGKPLTNQTFHVLDNQLQPCPVFVAGELFIGGIGVAKEYWREPEKTSQSFIVHPQTGERLYRTGDLGQYLPDGNIEFLGRKDFQVKINGYRVELGEVEAAMLALPQIQSVVANVVGGSGQAKQLVGYYVSDSKKRELEKIKFRLSQPGIRRFDEDVSTIALPPVELPEDYYTQRYSHRAYSQQQVPLEKFTRMLATLDQQEINARPKYKYGSGGALYPVQCYVYVKDSLVEGVEQGLYYYHPQQRKLFTLQTEACIGSELLHGINRTMAEQCAFQIFLIANLDAMEPVYQHYSTNLCLLEAGLMTQLIEQEAAALGMAMCQTGGFNLEPVADKFKMNFKYQLMHALVGGMPVEDLETAQADEFEGQTESIESLLRSHLEDTLPNYMVPSVFVELEKLPLSANGKVDRKALPVPGTNSSKKTTRKVEPTSDLAKRICSVWQEVLGKDSVGVEDNFFDLGGTSVDMIKIYSWLESDIPQNISLIDMFFTYPTIASLVEYISPSENKKEETKKTTSRRSLSGQKNRRKSAKKKV